MDMTTPRKNLVDQAIRFENPERIPIVFWNCDQTEGDVLLYHLSRGVPGDGTALENVWDWQTNEWGYHLESMDDGTMGHPMQAVWKELPAPGEIRPRPCAKKNACMPCRRSWRSARIAIGWPAWT